jgi:hypothetical protein
MIDPCLNPDGRDRYVNWFNGVVGKEPNPDPQSREHDEPWPGGRVNYYNFDLNRDWVWQTQIETQQRMVLYNQWLPQIHCDFHEQGYNQPYYFAPAAEPFHEVITPWQREAQNIIGRNHARYFDAAGWLYFTKERFDLFYPSYGDTYPLYNGAIGMTYEQGGHSRGGLAVETNDGDTLTLADRLLHHYTTSISTIETASKNAGKLVENFRSFFDNATKNGVGDFKTYVVSAKDNETKIASLKQLLNRNMIQYGIAKAGPANGYNYLSGKTENFKTEEGDLVISTTQPKGTLVKVLFEQNAKLVDSATYDITAWSLPYVYGLPTYAVKEKIAVGGAEKKGVAAVGGRSDYGYAINWNSINSAGFLSEVLQQKMRLRIAQKPFTIGQQNFAAGTLLLLNASNRNIAGFADSIQSIASRYHITPQPISTGFVDKGYDFACLTGSGVYGSSEVWFLFEQELHYPLTLINAEDAEDADLNQYDVIILPNGYYRGLLNKTGALQQWTKQGGTLIAMENAVSSLAANEWGLTLKKQEEEKPGLYDNLRRYADAERMELSESNPGSIFKMELDNTHPLAFGYPPYYYTLKQDNNVYSFLSGGWNVGIIKKSSQVAGFAGVRSKKILEDGVLTGQLPVGRGSVIFFADDPLFRDFWENGKLMFANAVFMASRN